jgi:hypothetical protein
VVDYLIKVRGYGFMDAVRHLTEGRSVPLAPQAKPPPKPKEPFALPLRNGDNERVLAYLQRRGIGKAQILACIERGSLYESAGWHNAVFVGRDDKGKARYATLRGTAGDSWGTVPFKRDADGSDKRFGFVLPPLNPKSDTVSVFESAVDCLSHQMLYPGFGGWRLSLGCTAPAALTNFLERHGEVKNCIVCTDNDAQPYLVRRKNPQCHAESRRSATKRAGQPRLPLLRISASVWRWRVERSYWLIWTHKQT